MSAQAGWLPRAFSVRRSDRVGSGAARRTVVFLTADDDGGLRVEQPSGGRVSLTPLTPDVFVEWDTADFLVPFQRDRRGRVRSFAVSLERARDVRFERLR